MLLLAQRLFSESAIDLDASLMSVSPAQNFLKPPPVPLIPTVTLTLGYFFWNSSPTASLMGNTVLEPSALTVPESGAAVGAAVGCAVGCTLEGCSKHPAKSTLAKIRIIAIFNR